MRSRADILPCLCSRARRSSPPPASASESRRFSSVSFCSRSMGVIINSGAPRSSESSALGGSPSSVTDALAECLQRLTRMSHKGGGERRKAARSAIGASSTCGNHRRGLLLRICSPSSPRMYRFFVRARQSTPQIGRRTQIRLATPFLSAAQSCDLQLPVHLAEQLQVRIARRQRHPDLAYGDANLGPDLEQL